MRVRRETHTPAQTHTPPSKDRLINAHTRPHTRIWLRKHQQQPSKLRRPPRLHPRLCGLLGGYIQWISRFSNSAQTPPSHTHTPLQTDVGGGEQIKPFSSQKKYILKGLMSATQRAAFVLLFVIEKKTVGKKKPRQKKKENRKINQGKEIKPYCHQPYCSRFRNNLFFCFFCF